MVSSLTPAVDPIGSKTVCSRWQDWSLFVRVLTFYAKSSLKKTVWQQQDTHRRDHGVSAQRIINSLTDMCKLHDTCGHSPHQEARALRCGMMCPAMHLSGTH